MKSLIVMMALLIAGCGSVDALETSAASSAPAEAGLWLVVGQSNVENGRMPWAFADTMRASGHPIALLNATLGGTAIECWRVGSTCYEERVKPYVGMKLAGILYWQGEQDALGLVDQEGYAATSCDQYGDSLTALIDEYRGAFGDVPFIVVVLQTVIPSKNAACVWSLNPDGSCPETETDRWKACREAQRGVLTTVDDVFGVEIEDVTADGNLHPSGAYIETGKRAAEIAAGLN